MPEARQRALPLGRLLVQRGKLSEAQLDAGLAEQAASGRRLGEILVNSGAISAFTLAAALAEQQGLVDAKDEIDRLPRDSVLGRMTWYEVRELIGGQPYRLHSTPSFADATDLAFAILYEREPAGLQVVRVAYRKPEQVCWQFPPPVTPVETRLPTARSVAAR